MTIQVLNQKSTDVVGLDQRVEALLHFRNVVRNGSPRKVRHDEIGRYVYSEVLNRVDLLEPRSTQKIYVCKRSYVLHTENNVYDVSIALDKAPSGIFIVVEKWELPYWRYNGHVYTPGAHNPIGEHLIILANESLRKIRYSIHAWPLPPYAEGQFKKGSYGTGCIRLRKEDMKALFERVELGSDVVIQ